MLQDYEKLGAFYLGRQLDPETRKPADVPLLYDSKDLVTHAVCVGMTGSGKTGLCVSLLEEAAIDGVPAIVIDPKGDLPNLLLTFPQLRPEDFLPWVNPDDAARKAVSTEQFAAQQAEAWRKGLASWGQDLGRIQKLRDSADFAVYTPGSTAGLAVSILRSFARPGGGIADDPELLREHVATIVTGLLGLAGVDADPLRSREHILLSKIVAGTWQQGRDLDLPGLIQQVQEPPVQRVGVLDLESFYPRKERFELALRLNNVMAAPGFEAWLSGEPLDVAALLHTPAGKPRVSIFSIAHLSDSERMFFVSLLLNQVLAWTRSQQGTTSLRAIVYMDEIFGFFPPSANPPSKRPLLTLLKQARAFGVGVVLATQNPVDLDYKGLANCGTWFIGRLQTERDKLRVLDGLEGAAGAAPGSGRGAFDRASMERLLSSLGNRVFLLHNVHEDGPVLFETRWAMSYLRGPLTRSQIKQLMDARKAQVSGAAVVGVGAAPPAAQPTPAPAAAVTHARVSAGSPRPVLPPQVPQVFLPIRSAMPQGASLVYRPVLLGSADVFFTDAKTRASADQRVALLGDVAAGPVAVDWSAASPIDLPEEDLETQPQPAAAFAPVPPAAADAKSYAAWKSAFADALYRTSKLELLRSPAIGLASQPGELERDFRARLAQGSREQRDEAVEKLRQKYAPKLLALQERIRKAEMAKEVQQQQASGAKWSTAMSVGATILGVVLGRKAVSAGTVGRATTAARGASRTYQESQDVGRAEQNVQALRQQLADLDARMRADLEAAAAKFDAAAEELERVPLRPKKTDVKVRVLALAWAPHWATPAGESPAWE
jgi:hypothetical protein